MERIKFFITAHKKLIAILLIILVAVGYWEYKKLTNTTGEPRYIMTKAQKGTIVYSISGSGQVLALQQIDLKPKTSSDVVYVGVKNDQEVKTGATIIQLNATDVAKSVRDAEISLESAKLSLEKLQQPADELSIMQAENALTNAKESKQNSEDDLNKAYDDGFNNVSSAFLELPGVMSGLQDILYSTNIGGKGQWNIDYYASAIETYDQKTSYTVKTDAKSKYDTTRTAYDKNFQDYKAASRFSDEATIEALISQSYETTKNIAEAVKSVNNLIQLYKDKIIEHSLTVVSGAETHLTTLSTYTSKTNTYLSSLLSAKNTIKNDKDAIVDADRTIAEKTKSLANLKAGTDELDLKSSQLSVKQRENSLLDAKQKYADYFVRAPFNGKITNLTVKKGDSVSSATTIGTIITKQKIAEISLNEVDAAKIKVGQKATLTFDAVEGLSIAGTVSEIDTIGTVSQGVVTYNVKIGFDTDNENIKPGMSVSASIIIDSKQDVLTVSNSAIKSQNGIYYVEMFDTEMPESTQGVASTVTPRQQQIEIGLASDTSTEITSGLKEGDQVVLRVSNGTTTTTQNQSLFGGSGGIRIPH